LSCAARNEDERKLAHGPSSVLAALRDKRVLFFSFIYFTVQISVYGVVFYLPTRIAGLTGGHVGTKVGLITAIPWIAAIAGTFVVTRIADRVGHHRTFAAAMLTLAALGIAASAMTASLTLAVMRSALPRLDSFRCNRSSGPCRRATSAALLPRAASRSSIRSATWAASLPRT
jgi:predicted MFS family arabinose efflux permease